MEHREEGLGPLRLLDIWFAMRKRRGERENDIGDRKGK